MCGICGYATTKRIPYNVLESMNQTMIHRGPDDNGALQLSFGKVEIGVAHRRLSVLDLSELGHQPMYSASGNSVITFNGEIYNYQDIRRRLEKLGCRFRTNCDTEVIIEAYEKYGIDCISDLNGMFAIAIIDIINKRIIFARDRFGKKPLYYYNDDNSFVFGSTLQPIINYPFFRKAIDKRALKRYMYYGYISEPDSIFENVYKLEPGTIMIIGLDDFVIQKKVYWDLINAYKYNSQIQIQDFHQCKEELRITLLEAIKRRMISDVPIGTFLSGGIDSSLVTAMAQTISEGTIKTYSIGFENKKYDESVYALEISKYLGTDHHNFIVTEDDMYRLIDDLPMYYDEPFADNSQLPSMIVAKMAKQDITVALTGDGGDELFCGYNIYDTVLKMEKCKQYARIFGYLGKKECIYRFLPPRVKSLINDRNNNNCQWLSYTKSTLLDGFVINSADDILFDEDTRMIDEGIQIRRMIMDMLTYLPGDILHKVDRATMKYSLESRCPILDYLVAELSFRIPHKYKYKGREKKHILKELLYDYVPKKLLDRPKKGFDIQVKNILLLDRIKAELDEYCSKSFVDIQGLFDVEKLNRMRIYAYTPDKSDNTTYVVDSVDFLWRYLVFQKWYKAFMTC